MRTRPRRRPAAAGLLVAGLVAGGLVAAPGSPAVAAPGLVTADRPVARSCWAAQLPAADGVATRRVRAERTGLLQVRLTGGGDWDLGVFDAGSGAVVAASAGFRTRELAEGFVTRGQQLVVQACRYAGSARSAALSTSVLATPADPSVPAALVTVSTPGPEDKRRLQRLGLDLTERATRGSVDVVVRGPADRQALQDAGLAFEVVVPDLAARARQQRAQDAAYARATARSELPSGRTGYRRLADYELEMKQLAARYPGLVRRLTLAHPTVLGRDVSGLEITREADRVADGKPVFLLMGLHHAREWPSGELALELAHDLLSSYGTSARTRGLVDAARTIVVPVVNPDGFTVSREAPELGDGSLFDYESKRKNCDPTQAPPEYRTGACGDNPIGRLRGTDLNRNYGGFWGGPGASPQWFADTFRGAGPFTEPETRNVRDLVSGRQVTTLVSNHTFGNVVLRPPGSAETREPVDEQVYRGLGARLAAPLGYTSQPSHLLYETSGATEDWSYWNTGGLAFTFEIGGTDFHPAFADAVVAEYLGRDPAAGAGAGGQREAYLTMLEATADTSLHATLAGFAPAGWTLRVHKEFTTPTSPVERVDGSAGPPRRYRDVLDSSYASAGGAFRWAVNPSTRPYVAQQAGRAPLAPAQRPVPLANPPGLPAPWTGDPLAGPRETVPFHVLGPPAADNGRLEVGITWDRPTADWDLYVVNDADEVVAVSAAGATTSESAVLVDPPPGRYRAVVVNFSGGATSDWRAGRVTFDGPPPPASEQTEPWVLSCERPDGTVAAVRRVVVARGETARLGDVCRNRAPS